MTFGASNSIDSNLEIPITIGTIPLQNEISSSNNQNISTIQNNMLSSITDTRLINRSFVIFLTTIGHTKIVSLGQCAISRNENFFKVE